MTCGQTGTRSRQHADNLEVRLMACRACWQRKMISLTFAVLMRSAVTSSEYSCRSISDTSCTQRWKPRSSRLSGHSPNESAC